MCILFFLLSLSLSFYFTAKGQLLWVRSRSIGMIEVLLNLCIHAVVPMKVPPPSPPKNTSCTWREPSIDSSGGQLPGALSELWWKYNQSMAASHIIQRQHSLLTTFKHNQGSVVRAHTYTHMHLHYMNLSSSVVKTFGKTYDCKATHRTSNIFSKQQWQLSQIKTRSKPSLFK